MTSLPLFECSKSTPVDFVHVTSADHLRRVIDGLHGKTLAADFETTPLPAFTGTPGAALDPHRSTVRLVQLWPFDGPVYVIDLFRCGVPLAHLRPLLSGHLVFHNATFDVQYLLQAGVLSSRVDCTLLAAAAEGTPIGSRGLGDLARLKLGIEVDKTLPGFSGPTLSDRAIEYAALDTWVCGQLWQKMRPPWRAYTVLASSIWAVATMELTGVGFDVEQHRKLTRRNQLELMALERDLTRVLGSKPTDTYIRAFISSRVPQWPRTDSGKLRVDEETLRRHGIEKHRIAELEMVLAHRRLAKLVNTYGVPLAAQVNPVTQRIHPSFLHHGAGATGRFSCSRPNLQQIPRDDEYRRLFCAAPGHVLVGADLSQIEIRVLAAESGDPGMLQAFAEGHDFHAYVASQAFGKPIDQVSREERSQAKAVGFGLIYGQSPPGLAARLGIDPAEAGRLQSEILAPFPKAREYINQRRASGVRGEPVPFRTGRIGGLGGGRCQRARCAVNYPIQGNAADVMLAGLGRAYKHLRSTSARPVLTVHDELIVECSEDEVEVVRCAVENALLEGLLTIYPTAERLGLTNGLVDVKSGQTWADLKEN